MLRDAGIDCVLLERDARAGGSTALSSGLHPGRRQRGCSGRRASPTTRAARFADDIQAKAHGTAAAAPGRTPTPAPSPPRIDALEAAPRPALRVARRLPLSRPRRAPHARAARAHGRRADGRAGKRGRSGRQPMLLTRALVRELWCDDERPRARRRLPAPRRRHGAAGAATCCCWPATASAAMRRWCASCCPRCARRPSAATPATTAAPSPGAGSSGARLADLGGYQGHGSWVDAAGRADVAGR